MEENKHVEELNSFSEKYIKEITPASPSKDFTNTIMNAILEEKTAEIYKPETLISKKVWLLLSCITILSVFYVARGKALLNISLPKLTFDSIPRLQIPNLFDGIVVTNTMLYACFFLTLLVFVQIYFLKSQFEKNL